MSSCPARPIGFAVLLLLLATPAAADDVVGYVNAGGSMPIHPFEFEQFWHPGFSLGGGIGVPIASDWQFTTQFQYQRFGADGARQAQDLLLAGPNGEVLGVTSIEGRDLTVLSVIAEFRFLFPTTSRSRTWFLSFGAGRADVSTSEATVTSQDPTLEPIVILGDTDAAFTTSVGAGVEIDMSPGVRLTLDSIYTTAFTEGSSTQFLPLRLGFAFPVN